MESRSEALLNQFQIKLDEEKVEIAALEPINVNILSNQLIRLLNLVYDLKDKEKLTKLINAVINHPSIKTDEDLNKIIVQSSSSNTTITSDSLEEDDITGVFTAPAPVEILNNEEKDKINDESK